MQREGQVPRSSQGSPGQDRSVGHCPEPAGFWGPSTGSCEPAPALQVLTPPSPSKTLHLRAEELCQPRCHAPRGQGGVCTLQPRGPECLPAAPCVWGHCAPGGGSQVRTTWPPSSTALRVRMGTRAGPRDPIPVPRWNLEPRGTHGPAGAAGTPGPSARGVDCGLQSRGRGAQAPPLSLI